MSLSLDISNADRWTLGSGCYFTAIAWTALGTLQDTSIRADSALLALLSGLQAASSSVGVCAESADRPHRIFLQ